MVGSLPNGSHWLPLVAILNAVLRLGFEETMLFKKLPQEVRDDGCRRLVVRRSRSPCCATALLTIHASTQPLPRAARTQAEILRAAGQLEQMVLCFENAHHFDIDSWRLLQLLVSQYSDICIVLTTRPLAVSPEACGDFSMPPAATLESLKGHIVLGSLSRDEVSLVRRYRFDRRALVFD